MTENDIKNIIYGSIKELMNDRKYFYHGYKSHWTEDGKELVMELMDIYSDRILSAVYEADVQRSKDIVLQNLKGDST